MSKDIIMLKCDCNSTRHEVVYDYEVERLGVLCSDCTRALLVIPCPDPMTIGVEPVEEISMEICANTEEE